VVCWAEEARLELELMQRRHRAWIQRVALVPVNDLLPQHPVAAVWGPERQASDLARHLEPAEAVADPFRLVAVVELDQALEEAGYQTLHVGETLALGVGTILGGLRMAFQENHQGRVLLGIPCQNLDLEGKVDIVRKATVEGS